MRIIYKSDKAKVSESFTPIGVAGLLLTGAGLGWLLYDAFSAGIFWGWGILAFILATMLAFAWVCTCYKTVVIDRQAQMASLVYRGGCGMETSYSLWKPTKIERPLEGFDHISTQRHFESTDAGASRNSVMALSASKVAVYTIYLESDSELPFPVLRNVNSSLIEKEAVKLAAFLGLPFRKGH